MQIQRCGKDDGSKTKVTKNFIKELFDNFLGTFIFGVSEANLRPITKPITKYQLLLYQLKLP